MSSDEGGKKEMTPPPEEVYPTYEDAYSAVLSHARSAGYGIRPSSRTETVVSRGVSRVRITCDRCVASASRAIVRPLKSRRVHCAFSFVLHRTSDGAWRVSHENSHHNHLPFERASDHACFRQLTPHQKAIIASMGLNTKIPELFEALRAADPETLIRRQDIYNYRSKLRRELPLEELYHGVSEGSEVYKGTIQRHVTLATLEKMELKQTKGELQSPSHQIVEMMLPSSEMSEQAVEAQLRESPVQRLRGACMLLRIPVHGSKLKHMNNKDGLVTLLMESSRQLSRLKEAPPEHEYLSNALTNYETYVRETAKPSLMLDKQTWTNLRVLNVLFSWYLAPPQNDEQERWDGFWDEAKCLYQECPEDPMFNVILSEMEALDGHRIVLGENVPTGSEFADMFGRVLQRYENMSLTLQVKQETKADVVLRLCGDQVDLVSLHEWRSRRPKRFEALKNRFSWDGEAEESDAEDVLEDARRTRRFLKRPRCADETFVTFDEGMRSAKVVERVFGQIKESGRDELRDEATQFVERLTLTLERALEQSHCV